MQRQPHSLLAPAPQVFTPRLLSLALAAALGGAALPATAQPLTPTVVSTPNAGFTYNLWNPAGLVVTAAGAITATDDQIRTVSVTIDVDLIENNGSIGTPTINQGIVTTKTVGLFDNRGTITAGIGLMNMGNITSLRNSGTMYGTKDNAILNQGSIVSLENTGEGVITAESGKVAIRNAGTIGTLTNGEGARIEGKDFVAITNAGGVIDKIVNAGTIESVNWANGGAIENFLNGAEIGEIDNSGLIKGATGLINQGVFGNIINSGTIYGSKYAIRNSGTMGTIDNSGSMYGTIENTSANDLVINGGVSRYGTLSALGNDPLIVNRNANVVFGQGKLQLFGDIDAGGHAVRNQTATLRVSAPLKIIGSYEQKKDATLELGVNEGAVAQGLPTDSGYGRLTVTNNTTLEAGTTVTLAKLKGYAFAPGQRFVAIATQGHAEYNLESLKTAAEGYSGNLSASTLTDQDASYLILTVGQSGGPDVITHPTPGGNTTPSTGATTNNATASLAGLFRYQGVNQDLLNVFNPAAALGDTEAANRAGAQLAPSAVKSAASKGAQAATSQTLDIANSRLDTMRSMPQGNSGVSTGERDLQPGVWGQYFGGRARQGERGDVAGYHARFGGMLVGADAQVSDNWRAGGMFSYAHTNVTNDQDNDGSSAKVDAYGLTAYAGYDGRPWYVNMMTGVVRQRYKSERDISYTGFSGNASGKYDGTQYVASVLAGYPIALGQRTTLTPLAGLSYSHLHQEGYTESGGNGAGLKVGSTSADSVKSDLGLKLEHVFDTSYGALTPNMQLRWRHEFVDSRVRTAASFAADPTGSTSFTSLGATPIKDTGVLVLGATLATRKNLTIGLNYTLEAASGYTSQTGDLRVRYAF